jgi:hypothetical protein
VIRFTARFAPVMTGTNPARRTPGVPPSLPNAGISPTPDQRSGFTPAGRSCLESMSRSGLSLTHNGCPFPDHHCKVNAPGLPLRPPAETIPKPGLPPAPPPLPLVCRQPRAGSSPKTRGSDFTSAPPASPNLHSPLGFSSLRIKAFSPAHRQRIHLSVNIFPNPRMAFDRQT